MLAYVFWHWKRDDIDVAAYESRLANFHRILASAPPDGLVSTLCHALSDLPWANAGGPAWEDWYLMGTSAHLDALNDAAVTAARQSPHDAAAAAAAGGTAGLFRLKLGSPVERASHAYWFAKPAGWSYPRLYEHLASTVVTQHAALWGRQMTLGPSREFCLRSPSAVTLPPGLDALHVDLRTVFPVTG